MCMAVLAHRGLPESFDTAIHYLGRTYSSSHSSVCPPSPKMGEKLQPWSLKPSSVK